jgi:O-antigen/teichoic acid export membrane protein
MPVSLSHKKNVIYNLIGQILPIVAGIISIPIIIKGLGTERFGIISLTWMIIGYFSLFDLGLGRALTQAVAEKIGNKKSHEIPAIFWTSLTFMATIAAAGSILIILLAEPLVSRIFKISPLLQIECLHAFYVLAISIPSVIITSALSGFLAAYNRFDIVNAIRIPMSISMLIAPLIVLPYTQSLVVIIALMTFVRIIFCCIHLYFCLRVEPQLVKTKTLNRSAIMPLLKFGGWMTISNIVGPIMVNFDRFVIGSYLSVTAVAYYTTPFEMITKLWMIPNAINGVTFPLYAASYNQNKEECARIFTRSIMAIFFSIYPIILIVITFAHLGMSLWVGGEFASHSYSVLQWLAIGVYLNCLAQVPYTLIQGANNPDITCKLHLMELVIYVPILFILLQKFGIEGAAIAWVLRTFIDTVLLFYIAVKKKTILKAGLNKALLLMGLAIAPLIQMVVNSSEATQYGIFTIVVMLFVAALCYVKPLKYLYVRN